VVNDQLEKKMKEAETERLKIIEEYQKNAAKHEEEVQLRLYFESKLNTLHHINRESRSKYKSMKEKFIDLEAQSLKQATQLKWSDQELEALRTAKHQLEVQVSDQ